MYLITYQSRTPPPVPFYIILVDVGFAKVQAHYVSKKELCTHRLHKKQYPGKKYTHNSPKTKSTPS